MVHHCPRAEAARSGLRRQPKQARSRQTVDALLTAASEVFDAHGFEAATTERIAKRAGVSVGSMYQYFPDKEALLHAVGDRLVDEVKDAVSRFVAFLATHPSPEDGIDAFVAYLVAAHEGPKRLRCMLFEDRPPPVEALHALQHTTVTALSQWLQAHVARPEAVAMLLHHGVSSMVHHFVLHPTPALPPDEAAREIRRMALGYVRAG